MSRRDKVKGGKASSSGVNPPVDPPHPRTSYIRKEINVASLADADEFKGKLVAWREEIERQRPKIAGKGSLPKQVTRPRIVELKLIGRDDKHCNFFIKEDNLYGIGFETMLGAIYEVKDSKHLVGSIPLSFKERYADIMDTANAGKLVHNPVDKENLLMAINILSSSSSSMSKYALAMLKIIVMVSESLRLNPILDHVHRKFSGFYANKITIDASTDDDWMLAMVQNWSKMCEILKKYQNNRGQASEEIAGLNLRCGNVPLWSYDDVESAVGLVLD